MSKTEQMPELQCEEVDVAELVNREYRERNRRRDEELASEERRRLESDAQRRMQDQAREEKRRLKRGRRSESLWQAAAGGLYLTAGAGMVWAMSAGQVCAGIAIALAVVWAMKAAVRFERAGRMWPR